LSLSVSVSYTFLWRCTTCHWQRLFHC